MHTARGCRDMLPIYSSETPGAKCNGEKYRNTSKPEVYTRLGISGATSSPWLLRQGQGDPQHRRHHGEVTSPNPSPTGHFPALNLATRSERCIYLPQYNISNRRLTTILRSRIS